MKSSRGSAQGSTEAAQGAALVLTPGTPVQEEQYQGLEFGWSSIKSFYFEDGAYETGACQNFYKGHKCRDCVH